MAGRITIGAGVVSILILVAFVGFAVWFDIHGGEEARQEVEAFCNAVTIDAPTAGIESSAKARGLYAFNNEPAKLGHTSAGVIKVGKLYGMSRAWNCAVEHIDGKVLSKRLYDRQYD